MTDVNVRGAQVEIRTVRLTKALLKQVRIFQATPPEPFRLPYKDEHDTQTRANPEYAVGWFRGDVLQREYDDFILLQKDGDLYLWPISRMYIKAVVGSIKQIYIV